MTEQCKPNGYHKGVGLLSKEKLDTLNFINEMLRVFALIHSSLLGNHWAVSNILYSYL